MIETANQAAVGPTTQVLNAAGDEVSAAIAAAIAAAFTAHGLDYQGVSKQANAFHAQLLRTLLEGADAYASAESLSVDQLVLGAINAPPPRCWVVP